MPVLISMEAGRVLAEAFKYDLLSFDNETERVALQCLRRSVCHYLLSCEEVGVQSPMRLTVPEHYRLPEVGLRDPGWPAPLKYYEPMEPADAHIRHDAAADTLYIRLSHRAANRVESHEEMVISARVPLFGLFPEKATLMGLTILNASEQDYVPDGLLARLS